MATKHKVSHHRYSTELALYSVDELEEYVFNTLSGYEPIDPVEIEKLTKERILKVHNLLADGELDKKEADFLWGFLIEAFVNAKMLQLTDRFILGKRPTRQLWHIIRPILRTS